MDPNARKCLCPNYCQHGMQGHHESEDDAAKHVRAVGRDVSGRDEESEPQGQYLRINALQA